MDRLETRDSSVKLGVWVLIVLMFVALAALVVLILTVRPGDAITETNSTTIRPNVTTAGISSDYGPASGVPTDTAPTIRSGRSGDGAAKCNFTDYKCNNIPEVVESARKQNRIQVESKIKKMFDKKYTALDIKELIDNGNWHVITPQILNEICTKQETRGISMAKEYFKNASGWPMLEGDTPNITWTTENIWEIESLFKTLFLEGGGLIKTAVGVGEKGEFLIKIKKPDLRLPTDVYDLLEYWMYKKNVAKLFGVKENVIEAEIRKVFKLEKTLNELIQSRKYEKTKRYTKFRGLKRDDRFHYISWNKLLSVFKKYHSVDVQFEISEDYLLTLKEIIESSKDIANFLFWRIAEQLAPYISRDFRTNLLFGKSHESALDYCLETVSRYTVPIIFSQYVSTVLEPEKKEVDKMVENIRQEMINYVNSTKASPKKKKLIEKIRSIKVHIGYPNELVEKLDEYYEEFNKDIKFEKTTTFLEAHLRMSKWNTEEMIKKNRMYTEWWNYDDLLTPTASYNEEQKYIAINIGLLEAPYFDLSMSPEDKYGSLGYTIADLFMKVSGDEVCKETPCSKTVNVVFKALKSSELKAKTTTPTSKRVKVTPRRSRKTTTKLQTVTTPNYKVTPVFQEETTTQVAYSSSENIHFVTKVVETMCKTHEESKVIKTILNSIKLMEICTIKKNE